MQLEYSNPDFTLEKRPFYPQNCFEYNYIMERIHFIFSTATNPVYYCMSCHSIETRHSIDYHKNCRIAKKSQIFGIFNLIHIYLYFIGLDVKDTQKNFLEKAAENLHIENERLRAVFFRKDMKQKAKITERKMQKNEVVSNNRIEDPTRNDIVVDSMAQNYVVPLAPLQTDDQQRQLLLSYLEKFDQKLATIDGKLSQTRNVVNGLVHDMNGLKNSNHVEAEASDGEIENRTNSVIRRGRGRGRGSRRGVGRGSRRNVSTSNRSLQ